MLPDTEREMAGGSARWVDLLAMATTAEAVGFDSLWVSDHLIFRFEGKAPQGVWECWSLLSALAAVTSRVEIGPLVSCTGFRNPALLAKMAAAVDEISNGRLILGLGAGWHEPEYAAFGYRFDHRVGRFEEAFTIIRSLLRDGHVDFAGRWHTARDCELRPRGPRPGGPPLMIGSVAPRMLALCARHADLWNVWGKNDPAAIPPLRDLVDAACREVGRDPATLGRTVSVLVDLPGRAGRPREREPFLTGSPEELTEAFRAYARAGISHVQVVLDPNSVEGIEALAPVLANLDRPA
jgi:alkanesulfonate monooxygenase SsuD/methylene tetrahydromethanopterin reductase-like flavin-dependent oxidoreductase (luciferase family)